MKRNHKGSRGDDQSSLKFCFSRPSKNCVKCGLCAKKCPVQAIDPDNPKEVDSKACISCMRCVSVCPHSARKVNGMMLAAVSAMLKKSCSERKKCELYI